MFGKFAGENKTNASKYRYSERIMKIFRVTTNDVCISRDEMVDFLLYAASFDASVATRSKISG